MNSPETASVTEKSDILPPIQLVRGVVEVLRGSGRLGYYSSPLGEHVSGRPGCSKITHGADPDVNRSHGLVRFLGDVPNGLALRDVVAADQEGLPRVVNPTQKEVTLKSRSIRDAVEQYFPPEVFDKYLGLLAERPDLPCVREEISASLGAIKPQFAREQTVGTYERDEFEAALQQRDGDAARDAARGAYEKRDALNRPELVLAFSFFMAGHSMYLSQFRGALERNGQLSDKEYGNARAVLDHSFQFFSGMTIYEALLTVVLHERNNLADTFEELSPEELDHRAIGQGVDRFFKAKILTSANMTQILDDGTEHDLVVVCPIDRHFSEAADRGQIQAVYSKILRMQSENPRLFEELIQQTRKATYDALTNTTPYMELIAEGGDPLQGIREMAERQGIDLGVSKLPSFPQKSLPPSYDPRMPEVPIYRRNSGVEPEQSALGSRSCPHSRVSAVGSAVIAAK